MRELKKNKSGISLMLSYVLLISIAVSLSIAVYAWMKLASNIAAPADCKEGTSAILSDISCDPDEGKVTLILKNNGYFNIEGIILAVGDETDKAPAAYLKPEMEMEIPEYSPGNYFFDVSSPLKPGETKTVTFFNIEKVNGIDQPVGFNEIKVIQIQPFIRYKEREKIICKNAIIQQDIEPPCKINP